MDPSGIELPSKRPIFTYRIITFENEVATSPSVILDTDKDMWLENDFDNEDLAMYYAEKQLLLWQTGVIRQPGPWYVIKGLRRREPSE